MKTFTITFEETITYRHTVQAEDEDQAMEMALKQSDEAVETDNSGLMIVSVSEIPSAS